VDTPSGDGSPAPSTEADTNESRIAVVAALCGNARGRPWMELFIFARFHARPGNESAVADAIHDTLAATREEPGCLSIHAFRSVRDSRLFYIHSRWKDEAAFEHHADLPHTVRFIARVTPLIDHPLDVTRSEQIG